MITETTDDLKDVFEGNGSAESPYSLIAGKGGHLRMLKEIAERRGENLRNGHTIFVTLDRLTFSVSKKIGGWEWIPGPVDLHLVHVGRLGKFNGDDVERIVNYTRDIVQTFSPTLLEE